MMKLSCRDMGMDCDFVAKGETAQEVKEKMRAHDNAEHEDIMKNMSEDEKADMMKKMDEKMMSE